MKINSINISTQLFKGMNKRKIEDPEMSQPIKNNTKNQVKKEKEDGKVSREVKKV